MGSGINTCKTPVDRAESCPEAAWLQASNSQAMHIDSDEPDACRADSSSLSVQFYQYHIVYLPSYSVPVLLFKAHNEGGYNLCVIRMCNQCVIGNVVAFLTTMIIVKMTCESGSGPSYVCTAPINCLQACLFWAILYHSTQLSEFIQQCCRFPYWCIICICLKISPGLLSDSKRYCTDCVHSRLLVQWQACLGSNCNNNDRNAMCLPACDELRVYASLVQKLAC